jgi:aspartate dehydrogenase
VDDGVIENADIVGLYDIYQEKCRQLASKLKRLRPAVVPTFEQLLKLSPDVVVEAASQQAVREYGLRVLEAGCDLVVMSVGALMDRELLSQLMDMARRTRRHVYIPSGAIAGLDAVYALSLNNIREVRLRTRKPPRSLSDSPYVREKGLKLDELREPTKIYEGPAGEAVKHFPANVNVAAALSLAAKREAIVEIVADPTIDRNIHEIHVDSEASKLTIIVENVPSPMNPRTSYLAALSAIALLKRLADERLWIA